MYYVYVLKGIKYYVGVTQDINRRLEEHRRGNSYFTRRIGKDITLIRWFACKEKKEAFALEAKI